MPPLSLLHEKRNAMSPSILIFLQFAIIAYAIVSGVFLAFSDFIMRSLGRTSGTGGVEAMQVINREVFRWVFMTLFIGMAPVSLLIAAYGGFMLGDGPGILMAIAGFIYIIGCFGVTIVFNVPMNEALARMDASSADAQDYWSKTYLPRWTVWNSVRTVACAVSAALLLFGLFLLTQNAAPSV